MRKYQWMICFAFFSTSLFAGDLEQAGIATSHPLATKAGISILEKGGNAFDAAITAASVLAVVEPYKSGLGGGGFFLLHDVNAKPNQRYSVLDAREIAPLASKKDMFISPNGRIQSKKSTHGVLAAAIPGEPEALVYLAQKYGRLPLQETLKPAIDLAKNGFVVDDAYLKAVQSQYRRLMAFESTRNVFLDKGRVPKKGFKCIQKDLANTLEQLAKEGSSGFYEGLTAEKMVKAVQKEGGLWSLDDLKGYTLKVRKPLVGHYHDWTIVTVPPPSAGGITLLTALNILQHYEEDPLSESDRIHLTVESLRRAYCDRAKYAGDPDFTNVPVGYLLSDAHTKALKSTIQLLKATPSAELKCGLPSDEKKQTTHFSIMDQEGNRVSATLTINGMFGSGYVVPGTGILLNSEMDDFSNEIGDENQYGLVGHASNLIAPQKRPVSSMMPTFLESKQGIAIFGTPGGSRIPSMMLLSILASDENKLPLTWVNHPRYHHQYMPDVISYEPEAFTQPIINALRLRGHRLEPVSHDYGDMQMVYWNHHEHRMSALSDERGHGLGLVKAFKNKKH